MEEESDKNIAVIDDDESDMVWKARDDAMHSDMDEVPEVPYEEEEHQLLDLNDAANNV